MKIGLIGAGNIGKSLALKLSAAGHDVKVANSRNPETLDKAIFANGARGVTAEDAIKDVDVVITSVPVKGILAVAPLIKALPAHVAVLDTFNYYPFRDGQIPAMDGENAQVESEWLQEQWGGRPVVKVFNSIYTEVLEKWGKRKGEAGRIAIPFAADLPEHVKIATELVEATGFDAYHIGPISESWRIQPGAPCYCVCPELDEFPHLLDRTDRSRLQRRRDLNMEIAAEVMSDKHSNPTTEWAITMLRVLNTGSTKGIRV